MRLPSRLSDSVSRQVRALRVGLRPWSMDDYGRKNPSSPVKVSRLFQSSRRNSESEPKDQRHDQIDENRFMDNFDARRYSMAF